MEQENPTLNSASEKDPSKSDEFIQTVVLNDGTSLFGTAGETYEGGDLWIWFDQEITMMEAVTLFSDPEKTSKITVNVSKIDQQVYMGYIVLSMVQKRPDGKVSVRMNRPSATN